MEGCTCTPASWLSNHQRPCHAHFQVEGSTIKAMSQPSSPLRSSPGREVQEDPAFLPVLRASPGAPTDTRKSTLSMSFKSSANAPHLPLAPKDLPGARRGKQPPPACVEPACSARSDCAACSLKSTAPVPGAAAGPAAPPEFTINALLQEAEGKHSALLPAAPIAVLLLALGSSSSSSSRGVAQNIGSDQRAVVHCCI